VTESAGLATRVGVSKRSRRGETVKKAIEGRAFLSAFIKADPLFYDLRNEPRYQEILRKMNLL
jgi:hypothetical protein